MSKQTALIDMDALRVLLAHQRDDIRIGAVDKETAKLMLSLGEADFYKELNNPETKIERSKKKGRFIKSSIIREFERIHGVPYKSAIEA